VPVTRGEGGLLRRLFERAADGMLVTRMRDGRIVMANEASARLLGVEHGDLLARTTSEIGLWPDEDRAAFVRRVRDEGALETREIELETPTGTRWVEVSVEMMTMGGRAHVLAILRDITERRQADDALRAERDHYAALVATIQDGYYVVGLQGDMIDVNDRFCSMVGYPRDEALAFRAPGPWWPPEMIETIMAARRDVMKTGLAEFDWMLVRRAGARFPVHVTSAVMHDAEGNVSGIVVTVRDLETARS
jgi:PAS domain S-box-containing protein